MKRFTALATSLLTPALVSAAEVPNDIYMMQIINKQQEQIEALNKRLDNAEQSSEAVIESVENLGSQGRGGGSNGVSIGGYGELHYNYSDGKNGGGDKKTIDFHRFVLFIGKEFTPTLRFHSEVEIEHAFIADKSSCSFDVPAGGFTGGESVSCNGDGTPGEVELEQAYIEYDFADNQSAKAGVFLIPVGIMNETHEPPTFYGVERNEVEKVIIPSTWWAAGVGVSGYSSQGISWDFAIHEGLAASPSAKGVQIRGGRQKSANASAKSLAATGRVKYTAIPGLELALSLQHQTDLSQVSADGAGSANLIETHAVYQKGPVAVRALFATWDIKLTSSANPSRDEQHGWYIEPSYRVMPELGVFARFEDIEGGRSSDQYERTSIGANYWLHDDVVLKTDFVRKEQKNVADAAKDADIFSLGIGYQF